MGTILIAMPRYEDSNRFAGIIKEYLPFLNTEICATGADTLRMSHERDYGAVICAKRLRDMSYVELSEYLPEHFSIIVVTKDPSLEVFSDRMIKLIMPFKKRELISTLEMITNNSNYRVRKKKNIRKRSQEEQKLIDDAKAMLMDKHGMSEPEAFRYIQKNSMDYGRTMVESAQMIMMIHEDT